MFKVDEGGGLYVPVIGLSLLLKQCTLSYLYFTYVLEHYCCNIFVTNDMILLTKWRQNVKKPRKFHAWLHEAPTCKQTEMLILVERKFVTENEVVAVWL